MKHHALATSSLLCFLALLVGEAAAEVMLPAVFADHMVLQRDVPLPIWGTADPGEQISVSLRKATLTTTTDRRGKWRVELPARPAGASEAVAYFFGVKLHEELDVPVGLIDVVIGGTPTEARICRDALAEHSQLRLLSQGNWLDNPHTGGWCRQRDRFNLSRAIAAGEPLPGDDLGPNHPFKPTFMWQAALEPLVPVALSVVSLYGSQSGLRLFGKGGSHHVFW